MRLLAALGLLTIFTTVLVALRMIVRRVRRERESPDRMQTLHVARSQCVRTCPECGEYIETGEVIVWLSRASGTSLGPAHARCRVALVTPLGLRVRPGTGRLVSPLEPAIEVDQHLWQRWMGELGMS